MTMMHFPNDCVQTHDHTLTYINVHTRTQLVVIFIDLFF